MADDRTEIQKIRAEFVRDLVLAGFTADEIQKITEMVRFVAVLGAAGEIHAGEELGHLDLSADSEADMRKMQAMVDALNRFIGRLSEASRRDAGLE